MNLRTMLRIGEDMRNQGYDLLDWVVKTSYQGHFTPDWESYLPY
jgi:hypothetical protein